MVIIYPITNGKQQAILEKMSFLGIFEKDIEERFIRGRGKGGQKKNKTSNCVQLKHLPTGIIIRFEKYRERAINQILARRLLCEKIEKKRKGEVVLNEQQLRIQKQKKRKARKRKKIS